MHVCDLFIYIYTHTYSTATTLDYVDIARKKWESSFDLKKRKTQICIPEFSSNWLAKSRCPKQDGLDIPLTQVFGSSLFGHLLWPADSEQLEEC